MEANTAIMSLVEIMSLLLATLTIVLLWQHLLKKARSEDSNKASYLLPWCATLVTLGWLSVSRVFSSESIDLNFYNSLIVASFVINLLALLGNTLKSVEYLGLLVLPCTMITVLLGLRSPEITTSPHMTAGMQVHIMTSLIAFSILGLAAVQAIFLFLQETSLRNHSRIGIVRSLPSLHDLSLIHI